MRPAVHTGAFGAGCVACVTLAEQRRMPWHASYIDVLSSGRGYGIKEKHNTAIKRAQARAKAKGVAK